MAAAALIASVFPVQAYNLFRWFEQVLDRIGL